MGLIDDNYPVGTTGGTQEWYQIREGLIPVPEPKPLEVIPATGETIRLRVNKEDHRVRFSDEDEKFVTVNIEPK